METNEPLVHAVSFQEWFLSYLWGMETVYHLRIFQDYNIVLILPMRNGNAITSDVGVLHAGEFLSYLWGMETRLQHLCTDWYSQPVLILPMRNGNSRERLNQKLCLAFLSYLWGMETDDVTFVTNQEFISSYPTYEEWKPCYGHSSSW